MSEIVHFAGHVAQTVQRRRRPDLPSVGGLVSSADRCSVSSVRGCVVLCVVCLVACRVQSVRVRWGWGLHRRGIQGEPEVGWSTPRVEKIQKRRFLGVVLQTTHPVFTKRNQSDCASLQIFKKIKKDPSPGLICAILDRKKGAL